MLELITTVQFQASQLGLGTQWTEIKRKYIEANDLVSRGATTFARPVIDME